MDTHPPVRTHYKRRKRDTLVFVYGGKERLDGILAGDFVHAE
jgi:hypothetical protein